MNIEQVKARLCSYDKRNPWYYADDDGTNLKEHCSCDACFYGKHELANAVLDLTDINERLLRLLKIAVEIIKNEYPESQWNDYAVDKMEAAIVEAGGELESEN